MSDPDGTRCRSFSAFGFSRRFFVLWFFRVLVLVTTKVVEHRVATATKRKELKPPNGDLSSFVLYSLNRCQHGKVNKIKGFATFEAVLCASLIDASINYLLDNTDLYTRRYHNCYHIGIPQ